MSPLAIPIIQPSIVSLRRLGRILHFTAGLLILSSALRQVQLPAPNYLYFWCEVLIGADILLMVFTSRNLAQDLPRVNLAFRLMECLIFWGASLAMLLQHNVGMALLLLVIGVAYGFVLYCERNSIHIETVSFQHLGVNISAIPNDHFFSWTEIRSLEAQYDCIRIETSNQKRYHFQLRKNLQFDELDQIHEFCRHYLGTGQN
jgi:hypothetical protein